MRKTNKFYQRLLSLALAALLCVGMMPMAAFAKDGCSAHQFGSRQEDPNTGRPYVVCKICGQTCTQVDEGGEHKCFNKIVFATCDKEGYTEYYCTECGYYETETFSDKLGHDWGGWTVERPATTAEEGLEKRVCNRDKSHVETRAIPKLEQNFFELKISYYDIDDGKFIADGDTHGHIAEGAVITGDQYLKDIPSGYEYANKLEGLDPGNKMPAHDTNLKVYCKKDAKPPVTHKLTIYYLDATTNEEFPNTEEVQQVEPGESIYQQVHDGKTPDNYYLDHIEGPKTMPNGEAVLKAFYERYRTVTIHYLEEGTGNILRAKAEISVKRGESISKDSPEIPGYTPDKGKVEFDNIQEDKTATVWYSLTQIGYKYTVRWLDRETKEEIREHQVRSIEAGKDIRIDSNADKTIEGYTFCPDDSDLYVPAENVAANGNTELKLVFTKNYTVTYNSNDGTNKSDPTTVVTSGTDVILKTLAQLGWETREGWRFLGWREEGAENVLDSTLKIVKDMNLFAVWEQIYYTVTYTDGVDGEEIFRDQEYSGLEAGVNTPAFDGTPSREGYTFAGWSPAVAATVTGNATYVAQWRINDTDTGTGSDPNPTPTPTPTPDPTPTPTPEPTDEPIDIPDPEPPLTESPDVTPTPSTPPVTPDPEPPVEIPDDDPPLAEIPDEDPPLAEIPDDTTEIDDEEVPLADVPKTGDDAKIWLTLALLSAAGLGVIGLMQRRTRKNGRDS